MGIRNAGIIIKEARLRAGLTQEQLSTGICSLASLYNIETGRMGVSPSTFQALMSRAGAPCEAYPAFKNRKDFDAFIVLKNVRLYTDTNCLSLAYDELIKLKLFNYGDNKFYYQEALFFCARIHYLTYAEKYPLILDLLNKAISISHPLFDITHFSKEQLSYVDYEIIFLMANVYINIGKTDLALTICNEANSTINKNLADDKYNAYIQTLFHFTYSKLLFTKEDYKGAKEHSDSAQALSEQYYIESLKVEIMLLKLICDYNYDKSLKSRDLLYMLSLASHLGYGFVKRLTELLKDQGVPSEYLDIDIPGIKELPDYSFDVAVESLSDGDFDLLSKEALTIGELIGVLRKEQRLSLAELSKGLCSVSKLSKIENRKQEPGIFLAEALLNRLGYSERDFTFYGNTSESAFWHQKIFLVSQNRRGDYSSKEVISIIEQGISSNNPGMRQLCILLKNSAEFSEERCLCLLDALKISLPDFDFSEISQYRLSWNEISLLNLLCTNYIVLKKYDKAYNINRALCRYSQNSFITPSYKNTALLLSLRLRYRYLYNIDKYEDIVKELGNTKDEFILKNKNSAADFFFYSAQACGELKRKEEMIKHARIAAGFLMTIGASKRKEYLISEIKKQFKAEI